MAATAPTPPRHSSTCLQMIFYVAALFWATPEVMAQLPQPFPVSQVTTNAEPTDTGEAVATVLKQPDPYASVIVSDNTPNGAPNRINYSDLGSSADAEIIYYAAVYPVPGIGVLGQSVPLQITSECSLKITGVSPSVLTAWSVVSDILVLSATGTDIPGFGPVINDVVSISGGGPSPTSADQEQVTAFNAIAGSIYEVLVDANATVTQNQSPQPVSASATTDPVIEFAPGFDSTGYTLEFSPGIGDSPEPASLTLLGIGSLGVLAYGWRRRRRRRR